MTADLLETTDEIKAPAGSELEALDVLPGPDRDDTKISARFQDRKRQLDTLFTMNPDAPDFTQKRREAVNSLGADAMRSSADLSNNLLDDPEVGVSFKANDSKRDAPETIREAGAVLDALDPKHASKRTKVLGLFPRGDGLEAWLRRFESSRESIERVQRHMIELKRMLSDSSLSVDTQKKLMWDSQTEVNTAVYVMREMIAEAEARVEQIRAENPTRAVQFEDEVLSPMRRHLSGLLEHTAISWFGYQNLKGIAHDNELLIDRVDQILNIAIPALAWSAMSINALLRQRKVIEAINTVAGLTGDYIVAVAQTRKEMAPKITRETSESLIQLEKTLKAMQIMADTGREMQAVEATSRQRQEEGARQMMEGLKKISALDAA